MKRELIGVVLITLIGMLATACKSHDQLVIDTVCPTACRCFEPDFPFDCEQECRFQLDPRDVSQECFDCYLEAHDQACFQVDLCADLCEATEPPSTVDGGPPFFVDAPIVIDRGAPPP